MQLDVIVDPAIMFGPEHYMLSQKTHYREILSHGPDGSACLAVS